ncbi:MAG: hypothetical protein JJU32_01825 [Phormidium sp. BM_Day4_Bin.17]|nr:hypothetical protein [Phormidium sp. BM_Day4_Bin.17]UCJ10755.1 MAG: hypothetical protein JWS08_13030 [Phormidium sp. PBR-2020]
MGFSVLGLLLLSLQAVPDALQPTNVADFIVFETDVTEPVAEGQSLRLYDVHVAIMYDRTQDWCEQEAFREQLTWTYAADGGNLDLGEFAISCRDARRVSRRYRLDSEEGFIVPERRQARWQRFVNRSHPLPELDLGEPDID